MKRITAFILTIIILLSITPLCVFAAEKTVRVGWVLREGVTEEKDGVYSGYNYDYLQEIARYTGWKYEFVIGELSEMTKKLQNGEIDLLGTLLYSEARAEYFDYSASPYGHKYTVMYTQINSSLDSNDFDSFNGITIGVLKSDTKTQTELQVFSQQMGFEYSQRLFETEKDFSDAIYSSEVQAIAVNAISNLSGLRMIAEFSPEPYYFVTKKGNTETLSELNRALAQINFNYPTIERELYNKYFSLPESNELTDAEKEIIDASKTTPVTVGVVPSNAPTCYIDGETGECKGILIDMLTAVSQTTGLAFNYIPVELPKGAPVEQLKKGKWDVVAGIIRTKNFENDTELVLSDSINNDSLVVVARKGDDFLLNADKKIITYTGGFQVAKEYIDEKFPNHITQSYTDFIKCLDALAEGKADAAVYVRTCTTYLLNDPHYENLEMLSAYYRDVNACVAGISGKSNEIVHIIDKGLAMLTESKKSLIVMNATSENAYRLTFDDILYKYRAPIIIIIALIFAVSAILSAFIITRRRNEKELKKAFEKQREAHSEMKAALALAEQASEAKGNFMSRMSHEIRTPLNAVIGYNTIAKNELAAVNNDFERRRAEMKVMDCLTKSDIASKHLLTIINDVLDMSAIESGKIKIVQEKFDFKGLITSLTAAFYSQAKQKGVEVKVNLDKLTEEWFIGDQNRINQVLNNLLSNAVKFTSAGGVVELIISQSQVTDNTALICFEIKDTGIGMSDEYMSHIWKPFEQADSSISRRFGGTGLGLSITKNLVDLMGGTISVASQLGKGTEFRFEITLSRTEQPHKSKGYDFSDINALVIDDDISTCEYIKLLFDRCGARCTTVNSGIEGYDLFVSAKEKNAPINFCLIDWQMPGMDGLQTAKKIRTVAGEGVPIIVITAYDSSELIGKAELAGVNSLVSKPIFLSSLFDLLVNIKGVVIPDNINIRSKHDFGGACVLLAEDNAMNMEIARRILETAGLKVDCAWNGREALDMFEKSEDGFYKAIIMDVQMPVMDGYQATKAIRASSHPQGTGIPIIAMTADAFSESVTKSLSVGMNGHITKPIDLPTLFETLKKYIPEV